ncbi:MAG: pantetheine-phosphate adenylyltransferase [Acidobacteria bacterium]|nr:pantetheine-phosphate adenylyltransferase [Acidobacteriota bacterium]
MPASPTRIALFPGTFDPITNGHVDLIRRATRLFDLVVVVTMVNPAKKTLFTPTERIAMIHESCVGVAGIGRIEVDEFGGLLVDYAKRVGASAIVRGLRSSTDFEYEHPMIAMNAHLAPAIDTVCLLASTTHAHISSRLVKEVASLGGSVTGLVPQAVEARLLARVKKG